MLPSYQKLWKKRIVMALKTEAKCPDCQSIQPAFIIEFPEKTKQVFVQCRLCWLGEK